MSLSCRLCVVFLIFFEALELFKNNFSFGSALQALLNTLVGYRVVRFLIVLANCVGYSNISCAVLLKSFIVRLLLSSENFAYRKTRLPPTAVSILFVKSFLLFNEKTK